jgi:hypothetical protein
VACPSFFFGAGPADTGDPRTYRTFCKSYPWSCAGKQPALDAPCISPGLWFIIGSLQSTPSNPIVIGGNTTVQGNFSVPVGTGITVSAGSTVTVQGCVSIEGDLTVDVSQNKPTVNGSSVDVILFGSTCNGSQTPDFRRVSVIGVSPADCVVIEAQDQVNSRGLSVVFTVYSVSGCKNAPSIDGVTSSTAAIIGGVVGGVALVAVIIGLILLYRFRYSVIPSLKLENSLRRRMSRHSQL